jgi:hypothetical protein
MGLYEFRQKPIAQQVSLISQLGIKLVERCVGPHQVSLHSLEYFFVEIWFTPKRQRVVRLVSCRDQTCFEPYLDFINISDLIQKIV